MGARRRASPVACAGLPPTRKRARNARPCSSPGAADDPFQFRWDASPRSAQRLRLALQDGGEAVGRRLPREGEAAGDRLEKNDAKGPEVSARVDLLAPSLLRRHVGGRPDHNARRRFDPRLLRAGRLGVLGDPEVEDLDKPVGPDHHVLRLDVAVDDPGLMCGGGRTGDLERDVQAGE